ncbi:MAG: hypothetical protein M3041_12790 [Acidobacteriota bacterium]|nr:hypothetical protein [Acidobacteriota bacterium]
MRKILIFLVVIIAIVVGVAAFLLFTTPSRSADTRALIAQVPASAESFAIIPRAASLDTKMQLNPITRSAIAKWSANHPFPSPWMIGGADLVAWKSGDQIRYFVRTDRIRAFLIRTFGKDVSIDSTGEPPIDAGEVGRIFDLASKLPPGDALVVQRKGGRGAYPPIGRPAVTSVAISPTEINITSVSAASGSAAPGTQPPPLRFPRGAILSAVFTQPPRIVGDLNRLFGTKISSLFEQGGALCIYGVDSKKLLPRPLGVIVLPNDPQRRAILGSFRQAEAIGIHTRTAEIGDTIALAFDDSIDLYQKDAFDPAPAANQWAMRIDAPRLVPILNDLQQNIGLRLAAPRIYRSARDLASWIGELEQAKTIEATDSADAQAEILRVRISAK